ncbi:MAG: type II toxin-antitoxin system prevent-host-death family antitoxin [Acidimicrobiia bacterium]|nr:type II toxin-antitoxin system prevent-host-death family antitoxin [Acidimicrobiia bacterium]
MTIRNDLIGAAEFKARCLQIMDHVKETGTEVTITKHGHPVAKLVPVTFPTRRPLIGSCRDSLVIHYEEALIPSTLDEWSDWEDGLLLGPGRSD